MPVNFTYNNRNQRAIDILQKKIDSYKSTQDSLLRQIGLNVVSGRDVSSQKDQYAINKSIIDTLGQVRQALVDDLLEW